jgi:hypothetical protein
MEQLHFYYLAVTFLARPSSPEALKHFTVCQQVVSQCGTTVVIAITKQLNEQNCYLSGI